VIYSIIVIVKSYVQIGLFINIVYGGMRMGRPCPVCAQGMFTYKSLLRHIKRAHSWYFKEFIEPKSKGGGVGTKKKEG